MFSVGPLVRKAVGHAPCSTRALDTELDAPLRDASDEDAPLWVVDEGQGRISASGRVVVGGEGRFDRKVRETFDIASFTTIIEEADIALASHIVVAPACREASVLAQLVKAMLHEPAERGVELVVTTCEPQQLPAWTRLGFRPYGLVERADAGTHVCVALVVGDVEHLREIDSPLQALSLRRANGFVARRLAARLASNARAVRAARSTRTIDGHA